MDVCKINISFNATEVINSAYILLVPMLIRKFYYVFFYLQISVLMKRERWNYEKYVFVIIESQNSPNLPNFCVCNIKKEF